MSAERLPHLQAAYVVARRDFVAVLFSRAFFFFLLGPLFPILVAVLAGGVGQHVASEAAAPQIGIAMEASDTKHMLAARDRLARQLGPVMPQMIELDQSPGEEFNARTLLERREGSLAAVITGTPEQPVLTATRERLNMWHGRVAIIAATALERSPVQIPEVSTSVVEASGASDIRGRMRTAQAGQLLLFLLIMLLAGMVLSNLVEEKGNKVIEILAAAIPMDAVFLGKLFAMLAISIVGVAMWATFIGGVIAFSELDIGASLPIDFSNLPTPGVGWPMFLTFAMAYFAMGYLLLGSVFLAIGSLAATVREVQTLSMPVTMMQIFLFFFASLAVGAPGQPIEWAAMAFPFTSPFAMLARAAQFEALWPHFLALAWQGMWVAISIKLGATLFRKRVMKSGPQGVKSSRRLGTIIRGAFRKGSGARA